MPNNTESRSRDVAELAGHLELHGLPKDEAERVAQAHEQRLTYDGDDLVVHTADGKHLRGPGSIEALATEAYAALPPNREKAKVEAIADRLQKEREAKPNPLLGAARGPAR